MKTTATKQTKKRKTNKNASMMMQRILLVVVFSIGLATFIFPFVSDSVSNIVNQELLEQYQKTATEKNEKDLTELAKEIDERNQKVREERNPGASGDPFSEDVQEERQPLTGLIDLNDYTIGVLKIPKIEVELPIFDRTEEMFISRGASLLEGTSYITGGESTHAVLSSHRGIRESRLFTDLPELEEGDNFYIEVNGETLAYEVDQIKVITPTEKEDLLVIEGEDLVTLLTCTPYSINSHRLLVRGHRVPFVEDMQNELDKASWWKRLKQYLLIGGCVLAVVGVFYLIYRIIKVGTIAKRKYNLEFYVWNSETMRPVSDVSFEVWNTQNTAPLIRKGRSYRVRSDQQGRVRFEGLPGDKYVVKQWRQGKVKGVMKSKVKRMNAKNFSFKLVTKKDVFRLNRKTKQWVLLLPSEKKRKKL